MKKIIVHLGLPKTATTTLQHHLFQKLHNEGKINFLGKVINFDEKTGKPHFVNNAGGIIRKAAEEKLDYDISSELDSLLVDDRVNVYSDEGLMVCYPGKENLPLAEKLANLKKILSKYDVVVLLTLRNPIDYFYSLYVQLYPEFYKNIKSLNTFEKFSNNLIDNGDSLLYESFFYPSLLSEVCLYFKTKVLLYEDMKNRPNIFSEIIADLLNIEKFIVFYCISSKRENLKKRNKAGVYSENMVTLSCFVKFIAKLTKHIRVVHFLLKSIYNNNFLFMKTLFNHKIIEVNKLHERPMGALRNELIKKLCLSPGFNCEKFGIDRGKLSEYGYFCN